MPDAGAVAFTNILTDRSGEEDARIKSEGSEDASVQPARNSANILSRNSNQKKLVTTRTAELMKGGDEVGVHFNTRARIHVQEEEEEGVLTRRLPQVLKQVLKRKQTQGLNLGHASTYAYSSYWRLPRFSSTSAPAANIHSFLEVSSLITCAMVLAGLALEPACLPSHAGNAFMRVRSRQYGASGLVVMLHLVNSLLYMVGAFAGRILIGRMDPKLQDEFKTFKDAAKSYMKSWGFWLDVMAQLGGFFEIAHLFEPPKGGVPSWSQWGMLLQLLKGWRVVQPEGPGVGQWDSLSWGMVRIFGRLAFYGHYLSCQLLVLGNQEAAWEQDSWHADLTGEGNCQTLYVEAMYFASLSLTSVGYGDSMITSLEHFVNCFNLFTSFIFTAKVCADLTWLTATHNHWMAHHQAIRTQTLVAMKSMHVPAPLAQRVLAYQGYCASVHKEDLKQPAFASLSDNLSRELRLCTYRQLVMKAPFLREQTKEVIGFMVDSLRDRIFLPADLIVCAGDTGQDLFFVRRGYCGVFLGAQPPCWGITEEVAAYDSGSYFGELAMLTGRPRAAWVLAKTYTVCSILPYDAIDLLSREFPKAFTNLVQAMVSQYKLNAETTWLDVTRRCLERGLRDEHEAFVWFTTFCEQGVEEDEVTAKAFAEGCRRLKVPVLDTKIFWAQLDDDNSGMVDYDEFADKLDFENLTDKDWEKFDRGVAAAKRMLRGETSKLSRQGTTTDIEPISPGFVSRIHSRTDVGDDYSYETPRHTLKALYVSARRPSNAGRELETARASTKEGNRDAANSCVKEDNAETTNGGSKDGAKEDNAETKNGGSKDGGHATHVANGGGGGGGAKEGPPESASGSTRDTPEDTNGRAKGRHLTAASGSTKDGHTEANGHTANGVEKSSTGKILESLGFPSPEKGDNSCAISEFRKQTIIVLRHIDSKLKAFEKASQTSNQRSPAVQLSQRLTIIPSSSDIGGSSLGSTPKRLPEKPQPGSVLNGQKSDELPRSDQEEKRKTSRSGTVPADLAFCSRVVEVDEEALRAASKTIVAARAASKQAASKEASREASKEVAKSASQASPDEGRVSRGRIYFSSEGTT
eukprot:TRINITY_DN28441_c0_g1_i1.p1 TRINITY_DN28441_c0_g1~~TRINITY_DN28441_c0_g1_i1.p1  ORF type:complete len:1085 (-),score=279.09 TRINITY_DN28441_c0_g1_i1:61-3315(-)